MPTHQEQAATLTPPKLAKRWGVSAETVIGFILAGELEGFNVASRNSTRPRYRITREAIADFERRRSAVVAPTPRRRRKAQTGVRTFY